MLTVFPDPRYGLTAGRTGGSSSYDSTAMPIAISPDTPRNTEAAGHPV